MIKRVSLVRRRGGMSKEEFFSHWTGAHAEIVRQLPGILGLRFGKVQNWMPEADAWDGVGEIWFATTEDAARAFATEPFASQLAEDRKKFLGEAQTCFVEEITVVAPPEKR